MSFIGWYSPVLRVGFFRVDRFSSLIKTISCRAHLSLTFYWGELEPTPCIIALSKDSCEKQNSMQIQVKRNWRSQ
jgi:hypothetical protein